MGRKEGAEGEGEGCVMGVRGMDAPARGSAADPAGVAYCAPRPPS